MPDKHSKKERSYNMSRIRSRNTKPEEMVRKYLFSRGLRYRKNVSSLPGKPDIVLPKYKTVVFVNGCFWHMHDCGRFIWPISNQDYWKPKLIHNVDRDKINSEVLRAMGWNVVTIWECQIGKKVAESNLCLLYDRITKNNGKEPQ